MTGGRFWLRTFGGLVLEGEGQAKLSSQRRRLALLALLAAAGPHGMAREKVLAYLWPESDEEQARNSLSQLLYGLRRELGSDAVQGNGALRLNPDLISVDAALFEHAVRLGAYADAAQLYRGPFLDGFYLRALPEFERWVEEERRRLAAACSRVLETLSSQATAEGRLADAAEWWRRLAAIEPLSGRFARRYAEALAATGDRTAALHHLASHAAVVQAELRVAADPETTALESRIRSEVAYVVSPRPLAPSRQEHESAPSTTAPQESDRLRLPGELAVHPFLPHSGARRTWTMLAGGVLAAVAVLAAALIESRNSSGDPGRRVLVVPFGNSSGDSSLDPLSRVTSAWIVEALTRTGSVDVVEGAGDRPGSDPDPIDIARSAKAAFVVTGQVLADHDSLRFQAAIRRVGDGRIVGSLPSVTGGRTNPMPAVDEVRSRVAGALAALVDPRFGEAVATITPPRYAAYVEYLAGLDLVQTRHETQEHFLKAALLDTAFSLALIWTAYTVERCHNARRRGVDRDCLPISWDSLVAVVESRRARLSPLERHALDFTKAWRTRNHELYYESAKAAAALVPVSFWTAHAFIAALDRGRDDEALAVMLAMRDVRLFDRVFPAYRDWLIGQFHQSGRFEDELAEVRRLERSPGPTDLPSEVLFKRARVLAALGMIDSAFHVANEMAAVRGGAGRVAAVARELRMHGFTAAADSMGRMCAELVAVGLDTTRTGVLNAAACAEAGGDITAARSLYTECCLGHDDPAVVNPRRVASPVQSTLFAKLGAFAALQGDVGTANHFFHAIDSIPIVKSGDTRSFVDDFAAEKLRAQARIAAALGDGARAVMLLQRAFDSWGGERLEFRHEQRDPVYDRVRFYPPFQRLVAALSAPSSRAVAWTPARP